MPPKILFLSYDGMSDPLGQSQVIPYLTGIAQQTSYAIDIISCEKPDRYAALKNTLENEFDKYGIRWFPIPFSPNRHILTRLKDIRALKQAAFALCRQNQYALTHCRSYLAAFIGQQLKKKYAIPLLFDMRGFWIDERVEGGLWNLKNPLYQVAYYYYKQKEKQLIKDSNAIISLTEAGRQEIYTWPAYQQCPVPPPIEVIPCSSDFEHFALITPAQKNKAKNILCINDNQWPVVSYLGSIGTWYMLDEMMRFFALLRRQYPRALMLFITKDEHDRIKNTAQQFNLPLDSLLITAADRPQVPLFLAASDLNIFFIKPTYAKKASSPVKLGEVLACGLPVIANGGVGDIEQILTHTEGGLFIDDFSDKTFQQVIEQLPELIKKPVTEIRNRARDYYLLEKAVEKYVTVYTMIIKK